MLSIGFILLTHANEPQFRRLVNTLNQLFNDPPIVCHHDFSQTRFDPAAVPGNVRFVEPHLKTKWGTISLVYAMLSALRLLYAKNRPDWFYFLSGADYPLRDGASIAKELAASPCDAFIRLKRIDHRVVPARVTEDTGGLESASYSRLAYQRYIARSIPVPSWRHPHRGPAAMHLHLMNPVALRPLHPFSEKYFCFAGDQWFAANSRAASALLSSENERLLKYLDGRFPPDEAFCPTVLGNASGLNIKPESKHYVRWDRGHHPRILDTQDLDDMQASHAHFARKFASDSEVLDVLDARLGVRQSRHNVVYV